MIENRYNVAEAQPGVFVFGILDVGGVPRTIKTDRLASLSLAFHLLRVLHLGRNELLELVRDLAEAGRENVSESLADGSNDIEENPREEWRHLEDTEPTGDTIPASLFNTGVERGIGRCAFRHDIAVEIAKYLVCYAPLPADSQVYLDELGHNMTEVILAWGHKYTGPGDRIEKSQYSVEAIHASLQGGKS